MRCRQVTGSQPPKQRLLSITAGAVFHDGLERLDKIREKLAYYPRDVWLYLLAAQWARISDEEAFVARTGALGDELGSRIIAARLIQSLMKLCFLMEKKYAPYSKWFGTAFVRLKSAKRVTQVFERVLRADSWRDRERHLSTAYAIVAKLHNALGITRPLDARVSRYYDRPYLVIHSERFADEIRKSIKDPHLREMRGLI